MYCFYQADTKEPFYIGSGCGASVRGRKNPGLYQRLILYRRPKDAHGRKIHDAILEHNLLLKVWIVENESDARKYESDAIKLKQPRLNKHGRQSQTPEQLRDRDNTRLRAAALKRKLTTVYNADAIRRSGRCKIEKPCSLFRKSASKRLAVVGTCKTCEVEVRRLKREKLPGVTQGASHLNAISTKRLH